MEWENEGQEGLTAGADSTHTSAPPLFNTEDADVGVAVVAEVKRASPSKGDIAPDIVASDQVLLHS